MLADANVDFAVQVGIQARFGNSGQVCLAAKRFILERPIADEFTRKFVDAARKLTLDLSALKVLEITVWSAWKGDRIASIGALKALDDSAGDIKSMRTHSDFLRRGVAASLLDRIIAEARQRGVQQLSLETESRPACEPALALYRRRGFVGGGLRRL